MLCDAMGRMNESKFSVTSITLSLDVVKIISKMKKNSKQTNRCQVHYDFITISSPLRGNYRCYFKISSRKQEDP